MLRAHRQAWCWQDEYHGLTMDDIRRLERETQLALHEKMTTAEAQSPQQTEDGQLAAGELSLLLRVTMLTARYPSVCLSVCHVRVLHCK